MSQPYLGQIAMFAGNFAPRNWMFCNGEILPIAQYSALFSLLGTTYGGNGTTTFNLPNLQGCIPYHTGAGFTLGQSGGEASHRLTPAEMPSHNHVPAASSAAAPDQGSPAGNLWVAQGSNAYSASG